MEVRLPFAAERTLAPGLPMPAAPLPRPVPDSDAAVGGRSVLALCDLSSAAVNAAWRAALIARDLRLPLRLLHAPAEPRVLVTAAPSVGELQQEIRERMGIAVDVEPVSGGALRSAIAAAREAAVLVLPSRRGNPLREWIMGTQAERLIRLCRAPVLVVKRPALRSYRRVLVPVQLEPGAAALVALAGALSRGSRVEVLHAITAAEEGVARDVDGSGQALRSFRQRRTQRAHVALHELIADATPPGCNAEPSVEFGDPAAVVLARAREDGVDLLVIGKRRRGLLADYFLGGVTQRVLARAEADVLVLPAAAGGHAALPTATPGAQLSVGSAAEAV